MNHEVKVSFDLEMMLCLLGRNLLWTFASYFCRCWIPSRSLSKYPSIVELLLIILQIMMFLVISSPELKLEDSKPLFIALFSTENYRNPNILSDSTHPINVIIYSNLSKKNHKIFWSNLVLILNAERDIQFFHFFVDFTKTTFFQKNHLNFTNIDPHSVISFHMDYLIGLNEVFFVNLPAYLKYLRYITFCCAKSSTGFERYDNFNSFYGTNLNVVKLFQL